jgi:nucleoside 2-deoxyribosyltransferase
MIVYTPPTPFNKMSYPLAPSVFLGGSIEMGTAEQWQEKVISDLQKEPEEGVIFNPRRTDWDSNWEQSIGNAKFKEQVDWELSAMEEADILAFYFDPATKSPITLFELGLAAGSGRTTIVYCPEGYWRKGNVDIYCKRAQLEQVTTYDEFVYEIKRWLW